MINLTVSYNTVESNTNEVIMIEIDKCDFQETKIASLVQGKSQNGKKLIISDQNEPRDCQISLLLSDALHKVGVN